MKVVKGLTSNFRPPKGVEIGTGEMTGDGASVWILGVFIIPEWPGIIPLLGVRDRDGDGVWSCVCVCACVWAMAMRMTC